MLNDILTLESVIYKNIAKPVMFQLDPELVHTRMTALGQALGNAPILREGLAQVIKFEDSSLNQKINGLNFPSPIGLAAGFDYKAQLPLILPSIGFGFGSVGTITSKPFAGNPAPRLGRLPKSKSLMVNKGFKNEGIKKVIHKWRGEKFKIPIGISMGTRESISDLLDCFSEDHKAKTNFSYYELNISCPNFSSPVNFYDPKELEKLLKQLTKLNLSKPVFVKMPINETNATTLKLVDTIVNCNLAGVIIGNLQKDRSNSAFIKSEVNKFKVGNFSGKPTQKRSDELIKLVYKHTKGKLTIIGCGGVFSAADAYQKIKNGASLAQLIPGLIYEGPLLPAQINLGLVKLLSKDNHKNVSEAVGSEV